MVTRPARALGLRTLFAALSVKERSALLKWLQQLHIDGNALANEIDLQSRQDGSQQLWWRFLSTKHDTICNHANSCVNNACRGAIKGWIYGHSITFLLSALPVILRGVFIRHPGRLMQAAFGRDTLRYATFLALFTGGFRGSLCGARHLRGREDWINHLLAGCIAGLALFIDTRPRRLAFSLYALTRAMHLSVCEASEQGVLPSIPHGDTLLMAIANTQIAWAFMTAPNTLSDSYWKFLVHQSGRPLDIVRCVEAGATHRPFERVLLEKFLVRDTHYSWDDFSEMSRARQVCMATHHYTDSCSRFFLDFIPAAYMRAIQLYLPLNVIGMVALRSSHLVSSPLATLGKAALSTLRSSLFLASYCTSALLTPCLGRAVTGKPHQGFYLVNGFIAGCMVLLEPPSRRIEVALYCFPRALESFAKTLVEKRWLPPSKIAEVPLFGFAIGIVMAIFHQGTTSQQGIVMKLLKHLLGDN